MGTLMDDFPVLKTKSLVANVKSLILLSCMHLISESQAPALVISSLRHLSHDHTLIQPHFVVKALSMAGLNLCIEAYRLIGREAIWSELGVLV